MTVLLVWILFTYGLAFMVAEARLFGCDTSQFNEIVIDHGMNDFEGWWSRQTNKPLPSGTLFHQAVQKHGMETIGEWWAEANAVGILPIRQHFLKLKFVRELSSCYYCLGTWIGLVSHPLFLLFFGDRYFWYHPTHHWIPWVFGLAAAGLTSGATCFLTNLVVDKLVR